MEVSVKMSSIGCRHRMAGMILDTSPCLEEAFVALCFVEAINVFAE